MQIVFERERELGFIAWGIMTRDLTAVKGGS